MCFILLLVLLECSSCSKAGIGYSLSWLEGWRRGKKRGKGEKVVEEAKKIMWNARGEGLLRREHEEGIS